MHNRLTAFCPGLSGWAGTSILDTTVRNTLCASAWPSFAVSHLWSPFYQLVSYSDLWWLVSLLSVHLLLYWILFLLFRHNPVVNAVDKSIPPDPLRQSSGAIDKLLQLKSLKTQWWSTENKIKTIKIKIPNSQFDQHYLCKWMHAIYVSVSC